MATTEDLINTLGGKQALHRQIMSVEEMTSFIRKGIPFTALTALASSAQLDLMKMSTVLMITPRTLARRRRNKRLTAEESDRVVRLARIVTRAREVFEDPEKAATWLKRPNRALRNTAPIDVLDTDLGAQSVETILGRIEHGVYS